MSRRSCTRLSHWAHHLENKVTLDQKHQLVLLDLKPGSVPEIFSYPDNFLQNDLFCSCRVYITAGSNSCIKEIHHLMEVSFKIQTDTSYSLFRMFDDLILLAKASLMAYLIPVKNVEEYFSGIGIHVTERVNPQGLYIDILEGIVKSNTTSAIKYKDYEGGKQRIQEAMLQAVDFLILFIAGISLGTLAKVSDENFGAVGYTYTIIAFWNNEGHYIANGPWEMAHSDFVYAGGVHGKLIMLESK
ncbi:hypothetical protein Tco_0714118 [Tanacetum coccineum]